MIAKKKKNESDESEKDATDEEITLNIFRQALQGKVTEIRSSKYLVDSPVRITIKDGALPQELQSAYRIMKQEMPESEKVLEVNLNHLSCQKDPLKFRMKT